MPKAHQPTAEQRGMVKGYVACGTPQEDVAKILGIDPKTLREHYRDELDLSMAKANAMVAQNLFKIATAPAGGRETVTAAIFWLKTKAGFKETDRHELVGKDGGPITSQQTVLIEFVGSDSSDGGVSDAG